MTHVAGCRYVTRGDCLINVCAICAMCPDHDDTFRRLMHLIICPKYCFLKTVPVSDGVDHFLQTNIKLRWLCFVFRRFPSLVRTRWLFVSNVVVSISRIPLTSGGTALQRGGGGQCPKISFCLGVRVENSSPGKIARVEILEQNVWY